MDDRRSRKITKHGILGESIIETVKKEKPMYTVHMKQFEN